MPKFGPVITSRIGKNGMPLIEYMLAVLRELRAEKKYWTNRQWQELYRMFDLDASVRDVLDDPDESLDVRDCLVEALAHPHAKNPTERSADKLVRYLENVDVAEPLNQMELYLLLTTCEQSLVVTKSMHSQLYCAIGEYFARHLRIHIGSKRQTDATKLRLVDIEQIV